MYVAKIYDETAPIDALEDKERERAEYLNTKGTLQGLTQKEFEELRTLFNKGVDILENK